MEKDEEEAPYSSDYKTEVDGWEPEDEEEFDEFEYNSDEFEEEGSEEDMDDDFDSEEEFEQDINDSEIESTLDDETTKLPQISDEEMKLVDDWWDEYKKMNDTEKERKHLIAFIERYPHLVDHLELYHEVLFELGADHFKKGVYEIFVELLLRIRKEYPITYKKSFKYYDSDLIYWFVALGRMDEIDPFFDYFREKDEYDDKLDDLIRFFHAINRPDIVLKSLAGTKYTAAISFITSTNIIQRYIDRPVTDESVQSLFDELSPIPDNELNTVETVKEHLLDYTRPFTAWGNLPQKRSQAFDYYLKINLNFAYFLYKNTELSFSSANVISNFIISYYRRIINNNKRPNNPFCLDRENITNNTLRYYNTVFWGYDMACLIELNALYYFVDYLKTCGNISEEQQNNLQKMITNLYQEAYKYSKDQGPEMLLFNQFPLWKIKE